MKKSKLLVLGVIALMLAGGLALASCGRENEVVNCPNGSDIDVCSLGWDGTPDRNCSRNCINYQKQNGYTRANCICK